MNRWTDDEGHEWPVTGAYCAECGLPLHRLLIERGMPTHFLCAEAARHGFPRTTMWTLPDPSGASGAIDGPHISERGPTGPTGADQRKHDGPTVQSGQLGQPASDGPTVAQLVAQLAPTPIRTGSGSTKIGGPRADDGRPLPCPECGHIFHRFTCSLEARR